MRRALLLAIFAATLLPLGARAQTITAAPGGNMTSLVGMPFDVPFYVDMTARPEKVGAFAASIRWDPAVLHLDGGSDGTFGAVTVNEDSVAGVVQVAGANPAGVGGLITLGVLHFTPLVAQPTTIHFALTELFAAGTFAALTPVTTRDGYFCPARGMFGDIDTDGAINSRDALIALSNAVGLDVSAFDITLGDVDANGVTNSRDALIILSSAVGLPVTGFRVGRLAGGACASNLPLVMAIVPSSVDLVVGQTVALEARAADSTGVLQTVTNVIWKSANTSKLAVSPDGTALAHDAGTVQVTAIRTALDSAQAVVHIVAHRTRHIVDAAATGARNQLGSAAFPFAQIKQAIAFAQAGDTVEVRAGRYAESVQLDRAAVLIGDTLPDGTRPLITFGPDSGSAGIELSGSGTRIVRDLAIDGFVEGVDVAGPTAVLLHGLRMTNVVSGVDVSQGPVGSLRLEASRLVGTGNYSYGYSDGLDIDTSTPVDTLVLQDAEISDFGGSGVYAPGADSLVVLRTRIHDLGEYGIEAGPNAARECHGEECSAPQRAPARDGAVLGPSLAFAMDSSFVLNANHTGVYLDGIRSAAFSRSILNNPGYAVETYGLPGGWARFSRDSIVQPSSESDWLDAGSLDSLTMDSLSVQMQYGRGHVYGVPAVRVTNSQFLGVRQNGTALYVGGSPANGVVTLDNVSVVGDPGCDACGEGLSVQGERVSANRVSMTNLMDAVDAYQTPGMTVTNSFFHHVEHPIQWSGSSADSTSRLTVGGTTFLGFYQAIQANYGGLRVDSSTFLNGTSKGVSFDGTGPVHVVGNTFTSVPSAIYLEPYSTYGPWVDTVAANVITDLSYKGIYVDADDSVPFRVLGNSVTCNAAGRTGGYGLELENSSFVVSGNQVSGCYQGIEVYDHGSVARPDSVLGNVLSLPSTFNGGIYAEGHLRARIAYNTLVADTAGSSEYGSIYVDGYQPGATAVIDSNTVTGGNYYGIFVVDLDTALVRYNTVQGVKGSGIGTEGGLAYLAEIFGNSVRGVIGNGLDIYNNDSAMVQVDSNLVASSTAAGIVMDVGADSVMHNRITGSGQVGIQVLSGFDNVRSVADSNNIAGNRFGVQGQPEATLQAQYNWWGDATGPQCAPGYQLCSASAGDSVSGAVNWQPPAATEYGNTPTPAVLARPVLALRLPAGARAVQAPAPRGLDAPVAYKTQAALSAPAMVARATQPRAAVTAVPPRLSGARAQAWQQRAQQRTAAALARVTQHHAAATVALAQVAAVRASFEQRAEQRQAQHEAKLKAKLARQAAARAAKTHVVRQ